MAQHVHYVCDTCGEERCPVEADMWLSLRFRRRSGPEVRYEPIQEAPMTCKWCMARYFGKVSAG